MKRKLFWFLASFLFGLGAALQAQPPVFEANLVAYYPLNGSGVDESGNNLNAQVFGAIPTTDRFGN